MISLPLKIWRRFCIQRFTVLDLIVYITNAGIQGMRFAIGESMTSIIVYTMLLCVVWGTISIFLQLLSGMKLFNGFTDRADIDQPRY